MVDAAGVEPAQGASHGYTQISSPSDSQQQTHHAPHLCPCLHRSQPEPGDAASGTLRICCAPNFRSIIGFERSIKEYPNIKVGEDFKGYQK